MKKLSILIVFLLLVGLAFGKDAVEELGKLINNLKNSSYEVERFVQESGIITLARSEKVVKSGPYKLVTSYSSIKGEFGWVRNNNGQFAIFSDEEVAFEPLTNLKDSEDNLIDIFNNKNYTISLFLDLPNSTKITLSSGGLTMEVTFDSGYRLLKLVKSYPFHTVSVSYRNYSDLSGEGLARLTNATRGMILVRPPVYLSEAMMEEYFSWSSMDFATDGRSYLYTLLMYSPSYGKMILYFSFNSEPENLQQFSIKMAESNGFSYALEKISSTSALSLLGMVDSATLRKILDSLH